ncbi:MAG: hypothetical protein R2762_14730 [Bryobacteraceae bacterium]
MPTRPVPADVKLHFVEKVARSATFHRAAQLRRMLQWLAERSESEAAAPTEHELGVTVLCRPDFDPQSDSLVRKEMSRLREKLTRYYATEGLDDEVRIRASGGYRLTFEWTSRPIVVRDGSVRPCLLMLPPRHAADLAVETMELHEQIQVLTGLAGGVDQISLTTALSYAGLASDVRTVAAECGADCVVEGSVRRRGDGLAATLWVVDGRSGRARGAGRVFEGDIGRIAEAAADWVVRSGRVAEVPSRPAGIQRAAATAH